MPATQTQLRRGTASANDLLTGAEGEFTIDTTNDRGRIHDGLKAGGFHVPNQNDVQKAAMTTATAGGSANALTLTLAPVPAALANLDVTFKAASNNSGAATLNVNGLGAIAFRKLSNGSLIALTAGDIVAGWHYRAKYDGTYFQLLNAAPYIPPAGLVYLGDATVNGNYRELNGLFSSNYGSYLITFDNVKPTLAGQNMSVEFRNAGSYVTTSALYYGLKSTDMAAGTLINSNAQFLSSINNTYGESGTIDLFLNAGLQPRIKYEMMEGFNTTTGSQEGHIHVRQTITMDGIRFGSTSAITGTIKLYGRSAS